MNHRDEKSLFGVGDAQVRNDQSVSRQPAFAMAVYSMMLMAAFEAYGVRRTQGDNKRPSRRRHPYVCRLTANQKDAEGETMAPNAASAPARGTTTRTTTTGSGWPAAQERSRRRRALPEPAVFRPPHVERWGSACFSRRRRCLRVAR
ncbi:MAG: hypothetical protein JJT96_19355, partial [Opitutales bacterium]|nr:hypothetical protein [Opitutales bacterium]